MPVTAEVKTILDLLASFEGPPIDEATPDELRANYMAMSMAATKADLASVEDRVAPGPAGDIPVRVYVPVGAEAGPRPVLVYFHLGGAQRGHGGVGGLPLGARTPIPRPAGRLRGGRGMGGGVGFRAVDRPGPAGGRRRLGGRQPGRGGGHPVA